MVWVGKAFQWLLLVRAALSGEGPPPLRSWALVCLGSRDLLGWPHGVPLMNRQPGEDGADRSLCSQMHEQTHGPTVWESDTLRAQLMVRIMV